MLKNLIKTTAQATDLTQAKAREAIGIVLNTAERQGAPLADVVFSRMPAARTLSCATGEATGASTGILDRLIEQTPGGRRHVRHCMFSHLHKAGLDHRQIAALLPAIGGYMQATYAVEDLGHIGDLVVADLQETGRAQAAVAA